MNSENVRPSIDNSDLPPGSEHLNSPSEILYPAPLSEISTNVARVPYTTLVEPRKPADSRMETEDLLQRKIMLSPVAEESPSPCKASNRLLQPLGPNMPAHYFPAHAQRSQNRPHKDLWPNHVSHSDEAHTSPTKSPIRPLSPGSQKMQNFLKRLEKQGLSHD